MSRRSISFSVVTGPWWLWVEHLVLLAFLGKKTMSLVRGACRSRQRLQVCTLECIGLSEPTAAGEDSSNNQQQLKLHTPALEIGEVPGPSVALPAPLESLSRSILATLSQIKSLAGPREVLHWPEVTAAPEASMDMSKMAEGQATCFVDGRGTIYKFKLAEGVYVNMYYTKAGVRRSGDLHNCNQYDVVLRGRTRLRMINPHTGQEVVTEYAGESDFIIIPARTPHMFEFLEDNFLLEWWDDTFKAWYYSPYRSAIEQGLPLQVTEGWDFSTRLPPPSHTD